MLIVALVGASTLGTQILINTYMTQFYPTSIRSTGVGFATAVGRIGAVSAPIVIGVLVTLNLPLVENFMIIASAALLGAIAIASINERVSAQRLQGDVTSNSDESMGVDVRS
jgi:AAHS family benzoate transporter-like MFS transporter